MMDLFNILLPALLIGLMVSVVHTPLGIEVLKRGIIFIDLAIAQIAGLGYISTEKFVQSTHIHSGHGHTENIFSWVTLIPSLGALSFALISGLIFRFIEKNFTEQLEAWIGVFFVLAASLSILILSNNPHGDEELKQLMSGQILFTTFRDVKLYLPFCIWIAAAWLMLPSLRKGLGFYFMFALTITATVQLIGIYVVFASLILPALVTFGKNKPLLYAWLFSAASMLMGIGFSALIDAPTGPMIVTTYVIFGILITLTNWAIQMKRE
jgi:zinc/manganese transport system permease protein